MDILDAHVHFLDPARPEGLLWPPADSALFQEFMPIDLQTEAGDLTLAGCVLIETSHRANDNDWMLQLFDQSPLVLGVVANLDPESDEFSERLLKLLQHPGFCGLRIRPIEIYDLQSHQLRLNLQQLAGHSKTIELGATTTDRLHGYASLAKAIPGLRCILDHMGHPCMQTTRPRAEWLAAIQAFADQENTYCKLSGLMSFPSQCPAPSQLEFYLPWLEALFEFFGPDRLVYGSNWPAAKQAGSYYTQFSLLRSFFAAKGTLNAERFFAANARRVYRLK
ncbi:MAG: amidohydrolase family protein [Xanthomonadales bacterium]|nr:amidohydrolase family protein [Xanthomonadales bacterium]